MESSNPDLKLTSASLWRWNSAYNQSKDFFFTLTHQISVTKQKSHNALRLKMSLTSPQQLQVLHQEILGCIWGKGQRSTSQGCWDKINFQCLWPKGFELRKKKKSTATVITIFTHFRMQMTLNKNEPPEPVGLMTHWGLHILHVSLHFFQKTER